MQLVSKKRSKFGTFIRPARIAAILFAFCLLPLTQTGCTSRAVTVTSLPSGAEVSINRRVIGKTPIRVNYTHYGSYRIEVRKDRYDPKIKKEKLSPPVYGYDPIAFVADNVLPARINDETSLHYVLQPVQEMDREALLARATKARAGEITHPLTQKAYKIPMRTEAEVQALERLQKAGVEAGPAALPDLKIPKDPASVIKEKPPEGPQLAKELGLDVPEKKDKPKEPKDEKADKKDKRKRRTPKGEIMIYDEEPIEDPDKKKK